MEIDSFELSQQDNIMKPSAPNILNSFVPPEVPVTPDSSPATVLGFRVGTLGFVLDSNIYCEIVDQAKVNPLPNVSVWFSGVLNLRGNIVPVIDLHTLLAEETNLHKKRHLLAIDRDKKTMAFWIDGYPQMIDTALQESPTQPVLPDILAGAITHYRHQGTQTWLSISLDKLFKSLAHYTIQVGA